MGDNEVSLGRGVSAPSPSYHLGHNSHFCLCLMVAGLMYDNYFLRCLEALSNKEEKLWHCVLFCT